MLYRSVKRNRKHLEQVEVQSGKSGAKHIIDWRDSHIFLIAMYISYTAGRPYVRKKGPLGYGHTTFVFVLVFVFVFVFVLCSTPPGLARPSAKEWEPEGCHNTQSVGTMYSY